MKHLGWKNCQHLFSSLSQNWRKSYLKSFKIDFLIASTIETDVVYLKRILSHYYTTRWRKEEEKVKVNSKVIDERKVHRQVAHYQCFLFLLLAATLYHFFCFSRHHPSIFASFWPISNFFITCLTMNFFFFSVFKFLFFSSLERCSLDFTSQHFSALNFEKIKLQPNSKLRGKTFSLVFSGLLVWAAQLQLPTQARYKF